MVTRYIKDAFLYGAGDSIVGQVRKANEDHCDYRKTCNGDLFVVCDGMGGHVGGATASHIGVDSIIEYISQHPLEDKRVLLHNALQFANMQILGAAAQDPSLKGMGTTACIVLVENEKIWIAHVGDSRIYLYSDREKYLYRITKDHSLVQSLVDKGELDDRDAEHHPQKNIILRALGTRQDLMPDVEQMPVRAQIGDTFLICSDGLSGMIDDNEIEAILKTGGTLEDKVQTLIDSANAPGKGQDNITAQLIQVLSSPDNVSAHPDFNPKWRKQNAAIITNLPSTDTPTSTKRGWMIALIAIVSVLIVALLLCVVLFLIKKKTDNKKDPTNNTEVVSGNTDTENGSTSQGVSQEEFDAYKAESDRKLAQAQEDADRKVKEAEKEATKARSEAEQAKKSEKTAKQEALKNQKALAEAQKRIDGNNAKNAQATQTEAPIQEIGTAKDGAESKSTEDELEPVQEDNELVIQLPQPTETKTVKCTVSKGRERKFTEPEVLGLSSAESKSIVWTSSDSKTVQIKNSGDKGFKGLKPGPATISGKKDGQEIYRIEVTVKAN